MKLEVNMAAVLYLLLLLSITLRRGSTEQPDDGCNSTLIQSLSDHFFTASSARDDVHVASAAKAGKAGWIARRGSGEEYLQINFDRDVKLTGLKFGQTSLGWYSHSVRISYSNDGFVWMAYNSRLANKIFGETFEKTGKQIIEISLDPPIKAQYIAIYPVSYLVLPSLTMEAYGCNISASVSNKHVTKVDTNIESDVVWIPSQSPFIIDKPITVGPGVKLSIQAGVSVVFTKEEAGLDVYGHLETTESSGLSTVFSSMHPVISLKDKWRGIISHPGGNITLTRSEIRQAVTGVEGDGYGVKMSYCLVHSCTKGIVLSGGRDEIPFNDPENIHPTLASISYMTFASIKYGLIIHGTISKPLFVMSQCSFVYVYDAVRIYNWDGLDSDVITTTLILYDFNISDISRNGISAGSTTGSLFVLNSNITRNERYAMDIENGYGIYHMKNISILNCSFTDNKHGIHLESQYGRIFGVVIKNNSFSDSVVNIEGRRFKPGLGNIVISKNEFSRSSYVPIKIGVASSYNIIIYNNTFDSTKGGLNLIWESEDKDVSLDLSNNIFRNIHGQSLMQIQGENLRLSATNNIFQNTSATNIIQYSNGIVNITENSFIETGHCRCLINVEREYDGLNTIFTERNYWGTSVINEIKVKMCDFFWDSSKSRVILPSIFTSLQMTDVVNTSDYDTFYADYEPSKKAYVIGGIISADMGIDESFLNFPVTVKKSILIDHNASIALAGTSFDFIGNTGIVVHGDLQVGTEDGNITIMQANEKNTYWNGIHLFDTDISVSRAQISGCKIFLNARGTLNINIENSLIHESDSLLQALKDIGDINITIASTMVDVDRTTLRLSIHYYTKNVNVIVNNSTLTSRQKSVLYIDNDSGSSSMNIALLVYGSSLRGYSDAIYIKHCYAAVATNITQSLLLSTNDVLYLKTSSSNVGLYNSTLKDYQNGIVLRFCSSSRKWDLENIDILNCSFNTSSRGTDIMFSRDWYERSLRYNITIAYNAFEDYSDRNRISINIDDGDIFKELSNSDSIGIKSNVFKLYDTTIKLSAPLKHVEIERNMFTDGKRFVEGDFTDQKLGDFLLRENKLMNNTNLNGIIRLNQPEKMTSMFKITDNWFVNNTGVVLSFVSPNTSIQHNYFENNDAEYNLRVDKISKTFQQFVVNAAMNFWGTVDDAAIASTIFDKDYDPSLLDVVFRPFLASMNVSDIYKEGSNFIRSSGDIGGFVSGEIVLTSDGNPYRVVHNIEVKPSGKLSLEAGVELYFDPNVGINVQGALNVNGTDSSPVVMTSFDPKKPWKGVQISGNDSSVLKNVIVNDTLYGINVKGHQTVFQNVTSSFSSSHGITIQIADDTNNTLAVTYRELKAFDNAQSGILIIINRELEYLYLLIDGCASSRNKENGVEIISSTAFELRGCDLYNNENGIYLIQHTGGRSNITSSIFTQNRDNGLYVLLTENTKLDILTSLRVVNNTFGKGSRAIYLHTNSSKLQGSDIHVSGNRIINNTNTLGSLMFINTTNIGGDLVITSNKIIENKGRLLMNMAGSHNQVEQLVVNIKSNEFVSNIIKGVVFDIQAYPRLNIHSNVFKNSPTVCELSSPLLQNSTFYINATHNYWGSRNIVEVINKVCGFDKIMNKTYVYYMPYYRDDNLYRLDEAKSSNFYTTDANGGEIKNDLTLSNTNGSGSVFFIRRSMLIRQGTMLTVAKGIALLFEHGRGIYVEGSLRILGEEKMVKLTNNLAATLSWYGLVLHSGSDITVIQNALIQNTDHGIIAKSNLFDMKGSTIANSSTSCLSLQNRGTRVHDFQGSVLLNCSESGIEVSGNGNVTLVNLEVSNSIMGLVLDAENGTLELRSCTFSNVTSTAISVSFSETGQSGNVYVEDCDIINSNKGIDVSVQNYRTHNAIHVNRNNLTNIVERALSIHFQSYWSYVNVQENLNRTVQVDGNLFQNACSISLRIWGLSQAVFSGNDINGNGCYIADLLDIEVYRNAHITISSNQFYNINAASVARLRQLRQGYESTGIVSYNQFYDNRASKGVVVIASHQFSLTQNIFESPDSLFDVFVEDQGDHAINASNNWWGKDDLDYVYSRIFDKRRDESLSFVNVTPILTERYMDCSGADNCSFHGDCTGPDRCRCQSGWKGHICDQYDCEGVNDCYGNGICVGPNKCQCYTGWSGELCIIASCRNVSNCNGHGICIRPNECACAERFAGQDCGSCEPKHWGSLCRPCPICVNGDCDLDHGKCICHSNNWSGKLCDQCSETFYGPDCLPLIMALTVMPNEGLDTGGNLVHIWGHNFAESTNTSYKCKFGSIIVPGTREAWDHVICKAPKHQSGTIEVEVSPDGVMYTDNRLIYTFYSTCPPGSCGEDLSPAHGFCLFGSCLCNTLWTDDNCQTAILPPVIEDPSPEQNATEGSLYTRRLILKQGDPPVIWALVEGPKGMSLNERTAEIQWETPLANENPRLVRVKATNIAGIDMAEWNIVVPFSYNADVIDVSPSGVLPYPKPVRISGEVTFVDSPRAVPVEVIISNDRRGTRRLAAETHPQSPSAYSVTYFPQPDDSGIFTVMARHPASKTTSSTVLSWRVKGMRCDPSYVTWEGFIDSDVISYNNISTIINTGGLPINALSAKVDDLTNAFIRESGTSTISNPLIAILNETSAVGIDLVISNPMPLSGTLLVVITSAEGLYSILEVRTRLSIRKPLLVFKPTELRESITRGTQKLFEIYISNIGDVPAFDVKADLPKGKQFSLVSFSPNEVLPHTETTNANGLTITPHGKAVMTVAVTVDQSETLGELRGRMAVTTNVTSGFLPYIIYITSLQTLTLNVTVTDEYTYFASDSPYVNGASVKLSNPRRMYSEERLTTNGTGFVLFQDIYEDRYTLNVEADDHSSYSAVIVASPDKTNFEVFLKRTAVKYEWTVTPTSVKDEYIITLESTFETFVPMPVVTIDPARVDTIPYEMGQKDSIEFTIINHGLIRANNVRLALPASLSYLTFEPSRINIGNLEANTTILVLVKTKPKTRQTRSGGCASGMLTYEVTCGGVQTYSRGVEVARGGGSSSCGMVHFHGHLSGGGGGYASIYSSSTSLSCDCAVTYIKSCILAFNPVAGCIMAIQGLEPGSRGQERSAMNVVLPIMDFIMGCMSNFHPVLSALSPGYTALRCIMDLESTCGKGRRRREASSEIVTNLQNTARSMDNFIRMVNETIGDEKMYDIDSVWYSTFKSSITENSNSGILLSKQEFTSTLETLTDKQQKDTTGKFLHRWNDTVAAWENGTLDQLAASNEVINLALLTPIVDQYLRDTEVSIDKGYRSIFEEFDNAVSAYKTAEATKKTSSKKDGAICAKVRIRITQDLVLTRAAFIAKLEMENGERHDLEDIRVEIQIRQTGATGELQNNKFSIGSPKLVGISGVDGSGSLGKDLSGSAEWLIIPYTVAAPVEDILYDIGGQLSYRVGNSEFSTPLLPDTLTVKSNPSLVVRYFHEKYVRGDDPLTKAIEPIIPFSLCVSVMNDGYGIANALKITSGQPEIVENEKGLLVAFKIIGAYLQGKPVTPSLSIDFGDIKSFETKTACWLLTTTLMGTFYNYSATFENINPLGDPQLSLLEKLSYHEMVHLVRMDDAGDDLDDFLVNDKTDPDGIPDRVFSSSNGSEVKTVTTANMTELKVYKFTRSGTKVYITINLQVSVENTSVWHYVRVENNITSPLPSIHQYLIQAERQDGKTMLLEKNVWQTTHILDKFYIHIFDNSRLNLTENDNNSFVSYNLTYGPRNMYPPKFSLSTYAVSILKIEEIGTYLLKLEAHDSDNDEFRFAMSNSSMDEFTINTVSGNVYLASKLSKQLYEFEVIVYDHGIPSKSSTAKVSVSTHGNDTTPDYSQSPSPSPITLSTTSKHSVLNTTENANPGEKDEQSSWIIPTAIGLAVLVCVVLIIAISVYVYRRNESGNARII